MSPKKLTALNILATTTLTVVAFVIFAASFWLLFPYEPITVHSSEVITKEVAQGDVLLLNIVYSKPRELNGVGVRSFVDGIIYTTPPAPGNLPIADHQMILREVAVPKTLPPGVYHLHNTVAFKVNPIRTVTYSYDTETFTVTPGGE